jgi:prolyl-tRNA synthetase
VVIIPIPKASTPADVKASMLTKVDEFKAALEARGVKVATDTRENYTPGWKYNHWELKGVPLRMELGPMDMDKSSVVLARRDTGGAGGPGWGCVMY